MTEPGSGSLQAPASPIGKKSTDIKPFDISGNPKEPLVTDYASLPMVNLETRGEHLLLRGSPSNALGFIYGLNGERDITNLRPVKSITCSRPLEFGNGGIVLPLRIEAQAIKKDLKEIWLLASVTEDRMSLPEEMQALYGIPITLTVELNGQTEQI